MGESSQPPRVIQNVRQKLDREGKPQPVWAWELSQGGVVLAFGERRTEAAARTAAEAASLTRGLSLAALR